jgi:DNA-binding beta-propeller fold protein YncE
MRLPALLLVAAIAAVPSFASAQTPVAASDPYKVVQTVKVGGAGGWDYVYADADGRRLYIPRGNRITIFDLDTLKPAGEIADTARVHGVAVDPVSHHAFSSSNPITMWDAQTSKVIKTIDVQGSPDGILFDPASKKVLILSHSTPNVTAINAADGSIAGTIDLGGEPEEAASDGKGRVYIDLEDKDKVAVVDMATLKLVTTYDLGGKGGGPAGLAMDADNHILFVACHDPATCVVLNADTGTILATLPIGQGVDAAEFNPATKEAFISTGDGVLTVIKESSPTDFAVEQSVPTKRGARTSTLDTKTGQIYLITAEYAAPAAPAPTAASQPAATQSADARPARGRRGGRGQMVPDSFSIIVVGK